jgi:hypothetical protein
MTTIITRLYEDAATARAAADALLNNGHDAETIDIIAGAEDTESRMKAARVNADSASAYAPSVASGKALLVVRAPFAPMGTARNAMKVVDRFASIKVGVENEDEYVREAASVAARGSILADHPLLMSNKFRRLGHGHILGSNPIKPSRPRTSAIRGGAFMSTKFWPMRLVSANAKKGTSAISGGWLISKSFGIPTLIGRVETPVPSILR